MPAPIASLAVHRKKGSKVGPRRALCLQPKIMHVWGGMPGWHGHIWPLAAHACEVVSCPPHPAPTPTHPPCPAAPQIQSVHVNPVDNNLVMSAGNDYTARILDIRNLTTGKGPRRAAMAVGRRAGRRLMHGSRRGLSLGRIAIRVACITARRRPACPAGRTGGSKGKAPVGAAPEGAPAELAVLQHSKVINSAYFSPITGGRMPAFR